MFRVLALAEARPVPAVRNKRVRVLRLGASVTVGRRREGVG